MYMQDCSYQQGLAAFMRGYGCCFALLSFDKDSLDLRVLFLNGMIHFRNGRFNTIGSRMVAKIDTEIGEDGVRAHVHGQDFINMLYQRILFQNFPDALYDKTVGAL